MPTRSRQSLDAALVPNSWVVLIQDQEGISGAGTRTVRDYYHHVTAELEADVANTATTTAIVQDSNNGITWTTRSTSAAIAPGGRVAIDTALVQRLMRIALWSTGTGLVRGTLSQPEQQASPDYNRAVLTCATFCEVDCETGAETYGDFN